jgi:hypothetical protein
MSSSSPDAGSIIVGTAESGARSESEDWVRSRPGLGSGIRGGDEERIPVVDVGIGVGYSRYAVSRCDGDNIACLLEGRGKTGEEDRGSKAGSSEGAGRLTPAVGGEDACRLILLGEESIMAIVRMPLPTSH